MKKEVICSDYRFESLLEIEPQFFKDRNIRLVMIELPNISDEIIQWVADVDKNNIQLFIYTNNDNDALVEKVANKLNLPYRAHGNKPMLDDFNAALSEIGYTDKRDQAAIIGVSRFIDILGGNWAGITTILVK